MKITEKVKNYEDICAIDGVDPINSLPYPQATTADEIAVNSFAKVIRINGVLNEGWQPDWNDSKGKYYPWFDMETYGEAGSGSGFSFFVCDYGLSYSAVGSRLVFKNRELATFAGETFLAEYRGFMAIEK